jgi:phosphoribosylamine--glycine ligase
MFKGELSPSERRNVHYGEVGLSGGVLVTSGASGYTLVITGTGQTIPAARDAANILVDKVVIPNSRYRSDIGQRLIQEDFAKLQAWGLIDND